MQRENKNNNNNNTINAADTRIYAGEMEKKDKG